MKKMLLASLLSLFVVVAAHAGHFRARVVVAPVVASRFYAQPVIAYSAPVYAAPVVAAYSAPVCSQPVVAAVNVQAVTAPIIGAYSAPASVAVAAPAVAAYSAPVVAGYSYGGSLAVVGGGGYGYGGSLAVRQAVVVRERVVVDHHRRAAIVVGGRANVVVGRGAPGFRSRPAAVRVDAPGVRVRVR